MICWGMQDGGFAYLHVDIFLRRCLKELHAQLISQLLTALEGYYAFVFHITLVSDQYHLCVVPRICLNLGDPEVWREASSIRAKPMIRLKFSIIYQSWTELKLSSFVMSYMRMKPIALLMKRHEAGNQKFINSGWNVLLTLDSMRW